MKNIWNSLIIISFISVSAWYFISKSKNQNVCTQYIESEYSGIIENTYFDEMNKLKFTFEILGKKTTFPYKSIKSPDNYVKVNDSIVKQSGKSYYLIYKAGLADSVIRLDFDCDRFLEN